MTTMASRLDGEETSNTSESSEAGSKTVLRSSTSEGSRSTSGWGDRGNGGATNNRAAGGSGARRSGLQGGGRDGGGLRSRLLRGRGRSWRRGPAATATNSSTL